jgi:hypothetical protein
VAAGAGLTTGILGPVLAILRMTMKRSNWFLCREAIMRALTSLVRQRTQGATVGGRRQAVVRADFEANRMVADCTDV